MSILKAIVTIAYAEIAIPLMSLFTVGLLCMAFSIIGLILHRKRYTLHPLFALSIPLAIYAWGVWSLMLHNLLDQLGLEQWWIKVLVIIGQAISIRIIQKSQAQIAIEEIENALSIQRNALPGLFSRYTISNGYLLAHYSVAFFIIQWIFPKSIPTIYPDFLLNLIESINNLIV